MLLKLAAQIVALIFAWGSGFLTGAGYPAIYDTLIIPCDTDADCEAKNPHLIDVHADVEGGR